MGLGKNPRLYPSSWVGLSLSLSLSLFLSPDVSLTLLLFLSLCLSRAPFLSLSLSSFILDSLSFTFSFSLSPPLSLFLTPSVNQVYIIGGDGTHRAADLLFEEIRRRKLKIVIATVPKTIDNDIGGMSLSHSLSPIISLSHRLSPSLSLPLSLPLSLTDISHESLSLPLSLSLSFSLSLLVIDRSFGFHTAIHEAQKAIISARVEACCTPNGIGIVKLMGRESGFIAAHATVASREVVRSLSFSLILSLSLSFSLLLSHSLFLFLSFSLPLSLSLLLSPSLILFFPYFAFLPLSPRPLSISPYLSLLPLPSISLSLCPFFLSSSQDLCLIPEVPFTFDGENGILKYIEKVLECQGHAVVVVAEGAGDNDSKEYVNLSLSLSHFFSLPPLSRPPPTLPPLSPPPPPPSLSLSLPPSLSLCFTPTGRTSLETRSYLRSELRLKPV